MRTMGFSIGRFQPVHNGHVKMLNELGKFDIGVIMIGSDNGEATIKNPFTGPLRSILIHQSLSKPLYDRVLFRYLQDYAEDLTWKKQVVEIINQIKTKYHIDDVTLVGYKKDDSSYYLDMFPNYHYEQVEPGDQIVNATDIRNAWYNGELDTVRDVMPAHVYEFLKNEEQFAYRLKMQSKIRISEY